MLAMKVLSLEGGGQIGAGRARSSLGGVVVPASGLERGRVERCGRYSGRSVSAISHRLRGLGNSRSANPPTADSATCLLLASALASLSRGLCFSIRTKMVLEKRSWRGLL